MNEIYLAFWTFVIPLGCAVFLLAITSCTSVGVATRSHIPKQPAERLASQDKRTESCYIETSSAQEKFSCSFVEFDGRGDFIDIRQHQHCYETILALSKEQPVLLVMYCHGWQNNAHSGDVVRFNSFLKRLAESAPIQAQGLRVHGVYLGWRGSAVHPHVAKEGRDFQELNTAYGHELVSKRFNRSLKQPLGLLSKVTYWSRKSAAEHEVSGITMSRAVQTYGAAAKSRGKGKAKVIVMGHSFGALMMEQSVIPAMASNLMNQWVWGSQPTVQTSARLPYDLVLLVNSAAPSIYALQTRGFLAAHAKALERTGHPEADAPIVISVTSTGDAATKVAHRVGNLFSPFNRSNNRSYDFGLLDPQAERGANHSPVAQSEFYKRTPGHNPMLVNHWVEREQNREHQVFSNNEVFEENLNFGSRPLGSFWLRGEEEPEAWQLSELSGKDDERLTRLEKINGSMPDPWRKGGYWFVECPPEIIKNHGDIWNDRAMDLYAALFRMSAVKRAE